MDDAATLCACCCRGTRGSIKSSDRGGFPSRGDVPSFRSAVKQPMSICDASPLVILGRNLSLARTNGNVGFTIGYFTFGLVFDSICLASWFAFHARFERTRVRPTAFVLLAVLSSVFQMSFSSLQAILSDRFPCYLGPILLIMTIPFASVSILGRLVLFAFSCQFSSAISAKLKQGEELTALLSQDEFTWLRVLRRSGLVFKRILHSTSPVRNDDELQALRFLLTKPGIGFMVALYSLPVFVAMIALLLGSPDSEVYRLCTNCDLSVGVFGLTLGFILVFVLLGIGNWWLVRDGARYPDVWGLKQECLHSLAACLVVLVGLILAMFDPVLHYPYSHLFMLSLGMWLLVASQTIWQLFLGYRADQALRLNTQLARVKLDSAFLDHVLANPELCKQFEAHLIAEFAVESLYFIKDAREWRQMYFAVAPTARTARARRIHASYIADSGMYTVNISSKTKDQVLAGLDSAPSDLFEPALAEIYHMLITGPVIRFYQTRMRSSSLGATRSRRSASLNSPTALETPTQKKPDDAVVQV
ncbi:hypothetical protein BASA81_003142 [Batrachochytrium salamandrivorans]|nr:hypothetical protein BASA81_003142 [Batrachochytrium salamandrivorans]